MLVVGPNTFAKTVLFVASGVACLQTRFPARDWHQLRVKVAVSVMGPPIVIEAGLLVPVKEPVPLPVQLVKLYPLAGVA
jgi:hypothetical protein